MKKSLLKLKKIIISSIIGVAILAIIIQGINISDLTQKITTASPTMILISFVFLACFSTLRAIKWRIIVGKGHFLNFFAISQTGNLLTSILPLQLQEPIKAVLLKDKENIKVGYGLSSIFIERLTDVGGLCFIGIAAYLLFPDTDNVSSDIFHVIISIIFLALLVITVLTFFVLKPKSFSKIFSPLKKYKRLENFYEKTELFLVEISEGFKEMGKKPVRMMGAFLIAVLMWLFNFLSVYFLFFSVGLEIDSLIVMFGFIGTAIGMVLAQSPGYIGTFEGVWVGIFSTMAYNNSEVLAVGVLYHILILAHAIILGILGISLLRLSIKELFSLKKS